MHVRKIRFVAALAAVVILLVGCGETVDGRQLENNRGLVYKRNADEPYSGKVTNFQLEERNERNICEASFKNGLLEGDAVCHVGKVKTLETTYSAGRMNGSVKRWNPDTGTLVLSGTMKDGLAQGLFEYFDSGTTDIKKRSNFKDGKYHGLVEVFNPDLGKLISKSEWQNGQRQGEQKEWDATGEVLLTELRWESGKQSGVQRWGDREENFKDGQLHGTSTRYASTVDGDGPIVRKFFEEQRRIESLGGGSFFLPLYGPTKIAAKQEYSAGSKVPESAVESGTRNAGSLTEAELQACTTGWTNAHRKEAGEEAMIRMEMVAEWESLCRQGKKPG